LSCLSLTDVFDCCGAIFLKILMVSLTVIISYNYRTKIYRTVYEWVGFRSIMKTSGGSHTYPYNHAVLCIIMTSLTQRTVTIFIYIFFFFFATHPTDLHRTRDPKDCVATFEYGRLDKTTIFHYSLDGKKKTKKKKNY
jgi:hypothetical protein